MVSLYAKIEYDLSYRKLDDEYFHVNQFFLENTVFSEEIAKTVSEACLTIF